MKNLAKQMIFSGSIFLTSLLFSDYFNVIFITFFNPLFSMKGLSLFIGINIVLYSINIALSGFMTTIHNKSISSDEKGQFSFFHTIMQKKLLLSVLITQLSTMPFLLLDIFLAKLFLPSQLATQYIFLSLIGKMIFFLGSFLNPFVMPLIEKMQGHQKKPEVVFYEVFERAIILTLCIYFFIGPVGFITIPFVFGTTSTIIISYLAVYAFAIALFTLGNQIVIYHTSKQEYIYPKVAIALASLVFTGISIFHHSIIQLVRVMFVTSILDFAILLALHIFLIQKRFIYRNIVDFLEAFLPLKEDKKTEGKKNRILIFNWRDTNHKFAGGAEVYIHELAKRWVKKGYQVTLFCGNDGDDPRHEIIDGVEIVRRGGFYFVYVWAFVYYSLKLRHKTDIIIDTQNGIPFFTPLYTRKKVYCLMFHVHQDVFQKSLIKPLAIIASFLEKSAMPFIYKRTKFITISHSTKHDMEKIGIGKAGIDIIFPGVDIQHLRPGEKNKRPMVLYLGRLKFYKSVHIFIEAAAKILKTIPDVEFVIAGEGEERKKLQKLANISGLENKITFLGKVTEEQKIDLYKKAWIFFNPSMMEGWGLTVIEANACGTPVVASDVPGLRDSISNPHTGYLVEYGNTDRFVEKVTFLLNNKEKLQEMSNHALAWAQKFDWEKSAEDCLNLITNTEK